MGCLKDYLMVIIHPKCLKPPIKSSYRKSLVLIVLIAGLDRHPYLSPSDPLEGSGSGGGQAQPNQSSQKQPEPPSGATPANNPIPALELQQAQLLLRKISFDVDADTQTPLLYLIQERRLDDIYQLSKPGIELLDFQVFSEPESGFEHNPIKNFIGMINDLRNPAEQNKALEILARARTQGADFNHKGGLGQSPVQVAVSEIADQDFAIAVIQALALGRAELGETHHYSGSLTDIALQQQRARVAEFLQAQGVQSTTRERTREEILLELYRDQGLKGLQQRHRDEQLSSDDYKILLKCIINQEQQDTEAISFILRCLDTETKLSALNPYSSRSLLTRALDRKHYDIAMLLLDQGASPDLRDAISPSPYTRATQAPCPFPDEVRDKIIAKSAWHRIPAKIREAVNALEQRLLAVGAKCKSAVRVKTSSGEAKTLHHTITCTKLLNQVRLFSSDINAYRALHSIGASFVAVTDDNGRDLVSTSDQKILDEFLGAGVDLATLALMGRSLKRGGFAKLSEPQRRYWGEQALGLAQAELYLGRDRDEIEVSIGIAELIASELSAEHQGLAHRIEQFRQDNGFWS